MLLLWTPIKYVIIGWASRRQHRVTILLFFSPPVYAPNTNKCLLWHPGRIFGLLREDCIASRVLGLVLWGAIQAKTKDCTVAGD